MALQSVRALTVDISEDLAPFCAYLWQRRLLHRVFEEQGVQVLEVATPEDAQRVRTDYAAWRDGRLQLGLPAASSPALRRRRAAFRQRALAVLMQYPVVACVIAIAVLALPATWPLGSGSLGPVLPWLTIAPLASNPADPAAALAATLAAGQWWRLLTPVFIHFGIAHLLFNTAVVIEFGRRIERGGGSRLALLLVLLVAMVSNVAQFAVSGSALFGGLSGVAYGLFGYVVARGRFDPAPPWQINRSFAVGMVVLLVLMSSGVTEWFGLYIANAAHWAGLGAGVAMALLWRPARRVVHVD